MKGAYGLCALGYIVAALLACEGAPIASTVPADQATGRLLR